MRNSEQRNGGDVSSCRRSNTHDILGRFSFMASAGGVAYDVSKVDLHLSRGNNILPVIFKALPFSKSMEIEEAQKLFLILGGECARQGEWVTS